MQYVKMVFALEQCTNSKNGRSIIIQVFAGSFCLSITGSCRGSDAQRIRNMRLTKDALIGESRMKNHISCVQLATPLVGLSGVDWTTPWLSALTKCGCLGSGSITQGLRKNGSEWANTLLDASVWERCTIPYW